MKLDRKLMRRNSTDAMIDEFTSKWREIPLKSMFDHPLGSHGFYSFMLCINFHSKIQKNSTCVSTGKKSTASLKNSTDVSAPSARFSNYDHGNNHGPRLMSMMLNVTN